MTTVQAPDILRCAYMEIVVTDLEASRKFYVDTLGLVVTEEDDNAIYLRTYEEFILAQGAGRCSSCFLLPCPHPRGS